MGNSEEKETAGDRWKICLQKKANLQNSGRRHTKFIDRSYTLSFTERKQIFPVHLHLLSFNKTSHLLQPSPCRPTTATTVAATLKPPITALTANPSHPISITHQTSLNLPKPVTATASFPLLHQPPSTPTSWHHSLKLQPHKQPDIGIVDQPRKTHKKPETEKDETGGGRRSDWAAAPHRRTATCHRRTTEPPRTLSPSQVQPSFPLLSVYAYVCVLGGVYRRWCEDAISWCGPLGPTGMIPNSSCDANKKRASFSPPAF